MYLIFIFIVLFYRYKNIAVQKLLSITLGNFKYHNPKIFSPYSQKNKAINWSSVHASKNPKTEKEMLKEIKNFITN